MNMRFIVCTLYSILVVFTNRGPNSVFDGIFLFEMNMRFIVCTLYSILVVHTNRGPNSVFDDIFVVLNF